MSLLLRMLKVLWLALWARRLDPLGASVIHVRVWPNDLDINLHMNNGRYLTVMDLGRLDLMSRTGLGRVMLGRRWRPIVASATLRFRRPLRLFETYELRSQVAGWDEKWIWIEQRFERAGELIALGAVKALLQGQGGNVATAEVLAVLGVANASPALPAWLAAWRDAEAATGSRSAISVVN